MPEERDGPESGPEGIGAGVDPVAAAIAFGGASREEADAFLREQRALAADQRHHLHEQLKQLHLGIWEKWLGVLLRVATAFMGLGIAAGLALMVWDAAHSNSLLIEPLSVPPDLAERGLSGQVIAAKLQDRLVFMERNTNSARPAKSYANSWGEHGIKLDIPETGISLTELDNYLRARLDHDIHVSGEVVRTASGIMLTARAGDDGAKNVSGPETEMDMMIQQLAESVYQITQPFRYGMFLVTNGRGAEALPVFEMLVKTGDKEDQLWAYNRWGASVSARDGIDAGIRVLRKAIAEDPNSIGAYDNLASFLLTKGRIEEALQTDHIQWDHLLDGQQTYVAAARIPAFKRVAQGRMNNILGAYHEAEQTWLEFSRTGYPGLNIFNITGPLNTASIGEHDLAAAHNAVDVFDEAGGRKFNATVLAGRMQMARQVEDWRGMLTLVDAAAPEIQKPPLLVLTASVTPLRALAYAHLGNLAAAQATIAPTPGDCYDCLRVRGMIAAESRQWDRADWWFARAAAAGPSLPFAEADRGQALLSRGQPDAAIPMFAIANRRSPHFADPIEMWGEALMAKNQSHLALAKFAEAEKYAPNWGRLHLKWGEALVYAGKRDEAKAQVARAAQPDLTPGEKAELARHP